MTTYYVDSAAAGAGTGADWTNAYTTLGAAVTAIGTGAGHIIYIANTHAETTGATTTYTFSAATLDPLRIISATTAATPPTTLTAGATVNMGAGTFPLTLTGSVYIFGVTFNGGTGAANQSITLCNTDEDFQQFESCNVTLQSTGSGMAFIIGGADTNNRLVSRNCTWTWGNNAGQFVTLGGQWRSEGDTFAITTTAITTMFKTIARQCSFIAAGCDFSQLASTTLVGASGTITADFTFVNCKMPSTYTALGAQTSNASPDVWMYNCVPSGGTADTHYHMQHHNYSGSTVISTTVYATAGAYYTGTTAHSWKIVTTANCSFLTPYVSPWIDVYNEATGSVTPTLEICRDGSATAYNDDEVWSEWTFQATSGVPLSTFKTDRRGLLASAAAQATGALGAGDWTGEGGTAWFGKLDPGSATTPAEIGHVRARVCVGVASSTVYVDPKIRGL